MVLDRASLKQESKALLKTARVNPYLFTLLVLAVTLVISGISNYMNMDDEFAYLYSVQYGIDLSFLALHRAFPTLVVLFVSIVCALLNMVLEAGVSLYHLGIRRGEEMPYVTLFDGFSFAGKIILLSVVQYIFVFLWTLLFIVPGIVAAYRYRFAILNPGLQGSAVRAGSELHRLGAAGQPDAGHPEYLAAALHRPEQHRLLPGDQKGQGHRLFPAASGGRRAVPPPRPLWRGQLVK